MPKKGYKQTPEHIKKHIDAFPVSDFIGENNPSKRPEVRLKISKNRKLVGNKSGNLASNWKGGLSKIDKLCRNLEEYRQWRSDVFQRDNWTCKTCGIFGVYVTAHHIKGFSRILKENNIKNIIEARKCDELWDIKNGITLCEPCHSLTDNYRFKGWIKK